MIMIRLTKNRHYEEPFSADEAISVEESTK